MKKILFLLAALFCLAIIPLIAIYLTSSPAGEIRLPAVIGDHMVLQRNTEVRLWGWASPNGQLRIHTSWDNASHATQANDEGRWQILLPTGDATTEPQQIEIRESGNFGGRSNAVTIKDILIGEVWLASGQSNMEMPLKGFPGCAVQGGMNDAILAHQRSPYVRMMNVQLHQSAQELEDCQGQWTDSHYPNTLDWSATAYYFASTLSEALQVPVGIVNAAYGGASVESWTNHLILEQYPDIDLDTTHIWAHLPHYNRPLLMYNAMFCPIRHYTYRGILWYQGESNVGIGPSSTQYAQRLANMVQLWRDSIGLGDIPFIYAEIAPYQYDGDQKERAPYLREQQYLAQSIIPNSYMISTNDLVEPYEVYNIHPRQKSVVGQRLCWAALHNTYGQEQVCWAGPRYKDMEIRRDTCVVNFTDLPMGICRNYDIRGFEVAGADRRFYPADEALFRWRTNQMLVRSTRVPHPVAVRYCFHDWQPGTLIGGNELPAFPFRTDQWEP
jgi:sialate O-acetylesterase